MRRSAESDLTLALDRIARVIAETLGFQVVVTNLYRRAWDDFVVSTVYGSEEIRSSLLGASYDRAFFELPMRPEFDHGGAFLIPEGAVDWEEIPGERVVPEIDAAEDEGAWHSGDELFVPFHGADGNLLGIFCVGLPASGRRPNEKELEALVAVVGQAAIATEAAQAAADASRQRLALEHLLQISRVLTDATSDGPPLQLVAGGIKDALGFLKVCIYTVRDGRELVPSALAGWPADGAVANHVFPVAEFEQLFETRWEHEGCFLVPDADASALVSSTHHIYTSEMNGRGEHAWQGDWLLVPLYGRDGSLIAVVWADDPADRLRPDRPTLQALRMFANHAAAAIEAARLLEQERQQVAQLRELDTMKDEFVALVSHELRTPLTSIRGYTELLREDVTDELHVSFLEIIDRSCDRLLLLVGELLLIAQLQGGKLALEMQRVELEQLLHASVLQCENAARAKAIDLRVEVDDGAVVVAGDPQRLGQVVDNLLTNAVKFTPEGGRVEVLATRAGGRAAIEVRDTGIGIPPDEQELMFSKFFRTSNARDAHIPGTGLGLAITKGLVEAHGGTIAFASVPGEGTTFRVELPVAA